MEQDLLFFYVFGTYDYPAEVRQSGKAGRQADQWLLSVDTRRLLRLLWGAGWLLGVAADGGGGGVHQVSLTFSVSDRARDEWPLPVPTPGIREDLAPADIRWEH